MLLAFGLENGVDLITNNLHLLHVNAEPDSLPHQSINAAHKMQFVKLFVRLRRVSLLCFDASLHEFLKDMRPIVEEAVSYEVKRSIFVFFQENVIEDATIIFLQVSNDLVLTIAEVVLACRQVIIAFL